MRHTGGAFRFRVLLGAGWLLAAGAAHADAAPEAPRLRSPVRGMTLTDVASFFNWSPVAGCSNFVIQVARDPAFRDLVIDKPTLNKGYHKNLYFPKDLLTPGAYFWRVRARNGADEGPWSEAWPFRVSGERPVRPQTVRTIGPETPLFLMRSRAWDPVKSSGHVRAIIPPGLERVIVVDDLAMAGEKVLERARRYQELDVDFVIWDNRCQTSLSMIEYVFQSFSRCIGIAEGEHFSGMYWEKGPEGNLAECDFVHRAWTLCGKYGRFYFFADGDGGSYRWPGFAAREKEVLLRYRQNIVPMFKTTNGDLALHSYGAVQGLMAAGYAENCGTWVDEWIWPCCGFGKLGESLPPEKIWENRRTVGTRQCPWIYDIQMWLMGIAAGSTVFQLESVHQWGPDGQGAAHYDRVFLPFIKAVVEHRLIPSRQAFLNGINVAVVSDPELTVGKHEKRYTGASAYLQKLYALTEAGDRELIPNNSRYGIVCLLPPGAACLNPKAENVPLAELQDPDKALARFNRAYPQRFAGDAFMWACDGTVIVTDTHENRDIPQTFTLPLPPGVVRELRGTIGVHQYLIGKREQEGARFWFQTNSERPDRDLALKLSCSRRPNVRVAPEGAGKEVRWDEAAQILTLRLSHLQGAAEVTVE